MMADTFICGGSIANVRFTFDETLYNKIRDKRIIDGLPVENLSIQLKGHPLLGNQICDAIEQYIINQVFKCWKNGWYIVIIAENESGKTALVWENWNCINPEILNTMELNNANYNLVEV